MTAIRDENHNGLFQSPLSVHQLECFTDGVQSWCRRRGRFPEAVSLSSSVFAWTEYVHLATVASGKWISKVFFWPRLHLQQGHGYLAPGRSFAFRNWTHPDRQINVAPYPYKCLRRRYRLIVLLIPPQEQRIAPASMASPEVSAIQVITQLQRIGFTPPIGIAVVLIPCAKICEASQILGNILQRKAFAQFFPAVQDSSGVQRIFEGSSLHAPIMLCTSCARSVAACTAADTARSTVSI